MTKFFDTAAAATADLTKNGWTEIKPGRWVSLDKAFRADISPARGEIVAVFVQETA